MLLRSYSLILFEIMRGGVVNWLRGLLVDITWVRKAILLGVRRLNISDTWLSRNWEVLRT